MKKEPGRGGSAWNRVRREVLRNATVCWYCGLPLDWNAPPKSRWAPSVDHIIPISKMRGLPEHERRRLQLDKQYLRPCHYGCNSKRGNRTKTSVVFEREHTREW